MTQKQRTRAFPGVSDLNTPGTSNPDTFEAPRLQGIETPGRQTMTINALCEADLASVVRLDARLTGRRKPAYWKTVFRELVAPRRTRGRVGLAAHHGARLHGYLLGEVRAFEFGSAPCGWIFAVGVDPDQAHHGIGSALVAEASRQFRRLGVSTVRTMVGRTDVPLLAFFRSNGFVGGSFTQLELELGPVGTQIAPLPRQRSSAPSLRSSVAPLRSSAAPLRPSAAPLRPARR